MLDVGTGLADIPARARRAAARRGIALTTLGVDEAESLARLARGLLDASACADARRLPFADASVDVVICSQVLHHFEDAEIPVVLARALARRASVRDRERHPAELARGGRILARHLAPGLSPREPTRRRHLRAARLHAVGARAARAGRHREGRRRAPSIWAFASPPPGVHAHEHEPSRAARPRPHARRAADDDGRRAHRAAPLPRDLRARRGRRALARAASATTATCASSSVAPTAAGSWR